MMTRGARGPRRVRGPYATDNTGTIGGAAGSRNCKKRTFCGDGICDANENCDSCPADCECQCRISSDCGGGREGCTRHIHAI